MATPEETAAIKEVFDTIGALMGLPEGVGIRGQIDGQRERGKLVGVLHSQLFTAHQLAGAILNFDRVNPEPAPDITTMPGARVERSTGPTGAPETVVSFPGGGPTFGSGEGFSVRSTTITEA